MTSSVAKKCQNCKVEFVVEPDDFGFYEIMKVPPPTWCPLCRFKRRFYPIGYRILYKRKCDFTGDEMISVHHQDIKNKVYRQDVWWSDKWNPKSYGREYDFSRPFFEQWKELLDEVPLPSLFTEYSTMARSEYCNAAANLKDCYLCFKADCAESCAYLNTISNMKDCIDVSFADNCELSYDSLNVSKCYQVFYSEDCDDSHNIYFSKDLVGCSNCVGCVGLRKKNYYIFNTPHTKEEYEKKFKELSLGSRRGLEDFKKQVEKFVLDQPRKEFHGRNIINSSGDYLINCKNVKDSFMVRNGENSRYCQLLKAGPVANSYDYSMFSTKAEWIYECAWTGLQVNNIKFGTWNYHAHDLEYSFGCHGSGNLFGCIGLRSGEYCILNKQYSKEEYEEFVLKIKLQMEQQPYTDKKGRIYKYGEYFPPEFSLWKYNESNLMEWFPLSREEALKEGFEWRDTGAREYKDPTVKIPDDIRDVSDSIVEELLRCERCGKNYQIIRMELDFYRRFQIPIPLQCPLCRERERIGRLNPMVLYERKCVKCSRGIKTSYAPNRPEIVYCEQCYQAEVV